MKKGNISNILKRTCFFVWIRGFWVELGEGTGFFGVHFYSEVVYKKIVVCYPRIGFESFDGDAWYFLELFLWVP